MKKENYKENNRNPTFGTSVIGRNSNVHSLKEKLLREIAQEGNVSLLKLTKDVIKGKYDDFSTLSTTSELIVVVKSSDLIEFEKLPVFEFVKRKHPHLAKEKAESDLMIQAMNEASERYDQDIRVFQQSSLEGELQMYTLKKEADEKLKEKSHYTANKYILGTRILDMLTKDLRDTLKIPQGMNNSYDDDSNLVTEGLTSDPIGLIKLIDQVLKGNLTTDETDQTTNVQVIMRWQQKWHNFCQLFNQPSAVYIHHFDQLIREGKLAHGAHVFDTMYTDILLVSKLITGLNDPRFAQPYQDEATRTNKMIEQCYPATLQAAKDSICNYAMRLNNKKITYPTHSTAYSAQDDDVDTREDTQHFNRSHQYQEYHRGGRANYRTSGRGSGRGENIRPNHGGYTTDKRTCNNCELMGHIGKFCTSPCGHCNATDHVRSNCPYTTSSRALKCDKCGQLGHTSKLCRHGQDRTVKFTDSNHVVSQRSPPARDHTRTTQLKSVLYAQPIVDDNHVTRGPRSTHNSFNAITPDSDDEAVAQSETNNNQWNTSYSFMAIGKPRARKWDSDSDDDSDDDNDEDVAYAHMVTDSDDATATAQTIDIECTTTQSYDELHYNVPTALQATNAYECVTETNHKVHISSIETIILDTGANVHLFGNPSFLTDIRHTTKFLNVRGIGTDKQRTDLMGHYAPLDIECYYVPGMTCNILCYADLDDMHHITTFTDKNNVKSFRITHAANNNFSIIFHRINKLYVTAPGREHALQASAFTGVSDIHGIVGIMTKAQRTVMERIAHFMNVMSISINELTAMVRSDVVQHLDITLHDCNMFEQHIGNPRHVVAAKLKLRQNIRIPIITQKERQVTLYGDLLYYDELTFLVIVSSEKLLMARLLEQDKSKPTLVVQIANIINTLRTMQVIPTCLYFDGEAGIDPEELEQQLQLKVYKLSKIHIGEIEVYNRLIKERALIAVTRLPFAIPARLKPSLIYNCVSMINLSPKVVDGLLVCPRELFSGHKIQAVQMSLAFGDYVEVRYGADLAPCIALQPCFDAANNYQFFNLFTNTEITACNYKRMRMRSSIINLVNEIDVQPPPTTAATSTTTPPLPTTSHPTDDTQDNDIHASAHVVFAMIATGHVKDSDTNNMSYKRAVKLFGHSSVDKSTAAEIQGMLDKNVFEPQRDFFWDTQHKPIIGFIFYKAKYDADGQFIKLKSRLVANGSRVDSTIYGSMREISGDTPSWAHTTCWLQTFAAKGYTFILIDIPQSYLNSKSTIEHHMILDVPTSAITVKLQPTWAPYLRNGKLTVKLLKSIYGLKESGRNWSNTLTTSLVSYGFIQNRLDPCVYQHQSINIALLVYVDDIIIASTTQQESENFILWMNSKFGPVTKSKYDDFSYLGIKIAIKDTTVHLSSNTYIDNIIRDNHNLIDTATIHNVPATTHIITKQVDPVILSKGEIDHFHSTVARLLYIALRVRIDILFAVTILASRVSHPTQHDRADLIRLLTYLSHTPKKSILLKCDNKNPTLSVYADASYGIHDNKKSHTGIYITLGSGPILVKSSKQKVVSKSSTEAEIYALSACVGLALGICNFLQSLYVSLKTITIYEDNMSVIQMMHTGRPTSDATRHIAIHNFFIHEKLNSGQISLTHIDTNQMLADIFTKPITGQQFSQLLLKCGMTDFPPDPPSTTSSPSNLDIRITEGDQVSVAYRHPALRGNSHDPTSSSSSTRISVRQGHVDHFAPRENCHSKIARTEASIRVQPKQNKLRSKSSGTA